ncbi:bacterial PH domain protein [Geobacillus kaustophilus]|uniref:Bacterial PH domain protein n=1 Tax=Geobacillus kaustophilus TaxID=1462 RepID=A0A0D8BY26_GEOKU|nr:PH domain-containing protein [Geobacillus kaustophilus]KJE29035.1 bacterial PH domain protein [Geobacillus kaustophilus]
MEEISKEFPKTERTFYQYAFKALKKVMKEGEKIYSFNVADPKLTKTGFIVVGEHNLYFVAMKGGLFGGAEAEVVKYKDIKSVDFDIIPSPIALMNTGIIYLEMKGLFGSKKRTIRNIPDYNIDSIVKAIRDRISEHSVKA